MSRKPCVVLAAALLLAAALGSGCASHSIREGIWRLSFEAQNAETRERVAVPVQQVSVRVEWGSEQPGEAVELTPISSHSPGRTKDTSILKRMFGRIKPGGEEIELWHSDSQWESRLAGRIVNPEYINGQGFLARSHLAERIMLEGRWEMSWVSDE
jgi:hypothetical protein